MGMRFYRHRDARGQRDELITIIEDENMVEIDEEGQKIPTFKYVGNDTIKAHPMVIDSLLENAEPLWTLEEILAKLEG